MILAAFLTLVSPVAAPLMDGDQSWEWCQTANILGTNWAYTPAFPNTPENYRRAVRALGQVAWSKFSTQVSEENVLCFSASRDAVDTGIAKSVRQNRANGITVYEAPFPAS